MDDMVCVFERGSQSLYRAAFRAAEVGVAYGLGHHRAGGRATSRASHAIGDQDQGALLARDRGAIRPKHQIAVLVGAAHLPYVG